MLVLFGNTFERKICLVSLFINCHDFQSREGLELNREEGRAYSKIELLDGRAY